VHGVAVGKLRILSDPANEIREITGEVELFAGSIAVLGILLVICLLWAVHRSLLPLQALADGFDRLERGDYRPIAPIAVSELQQITRQFNRLAESLHHVTLDNRLLIDKLLSMQEQERKALAADLHDEFGPVLFGIRADAACIIRSVPSGTEVYARAQSITGLADGIQKVNYRILDRLRPLVLEQMGLCQALRQQVNSWRTTYPHIMWSLDIAPGFRDPSEAISFTLYRAAQEGATNAVRHARASAINVRLERRCARAAQSMFLAVEDDGRGLPDDFRRGFGLLGLNERVRQLDGTLAIRAWHPAGVAIEVTVPEQEQPASDEVGKCGFC
jgi:two-component system sensor histidine kinase UhpB